MTGPGTGATVKPPAERAAGGSAGRVCVAAALALLLAAPLAADMLVLRDGTRFHGIVLSQDEHFVTFRVFTRDGRSYADRTFAMRLVDRIELGVGLPDDPNDDDRAGPYEPLPDFEQMLREAFELIDDDDRPAALRALQRVVGRAPAETLAELERFTHATRGVALEDLLAENRILVALRTRSGGTFRIDHATRYESAALARRLEAIERELVGRRYHGRTLADWAFEPHEYDRLWPDAPRMVADAEFATGVMGARLRHDPRLAQDRHARRGLVAARDRMARFAAHVASMTGFTSLRMRDDGADPTLREARRLEAIASQPSPEKHDFVGPPAP